MTSLVLRLLDLAAHLPGDIPPDPWQDPDAGSRWVVPAVAALVVVAVVAAITVAVVLMRRKR